MSTSTTSETPESTEDQDKGYRIIRLESENFLRLKAVEIEPEDSGAVIVSGKNGQGKTSVLDSILSALAGKRECPDQPIHEGKDEAEIKLEIGRDGIEYVIVRRWTDPEDPDKTYLTILDPEGEEIDRAPQSFLNDLLGTLSFDPLEFAKRKKPREQRDMLLDLIELPVDLDELEEERQEYYEERRDVNRDLKKAKGKLDKMEEPPEDLPEESVDINDLATERDNLKDKVDLLTKKIDDLGNHRQSLVEDVERVEELLPDYDAPDCEKEIDEIIDPEIIDPLVVDLRNRRGQLKEEIESLKDQIDSAQETNEAIRDAEDYEETKQEVQDLEDESERLTRQIEQVDETKEEVLESADLPINRLGFSEDGVTLDGKPFSQACDSDQLKVSAAIAMEMNPDLRILRMKEGSLLDSDNLTVLDELAKEYDFQVWTEVVDDSGERGIYIEDGEVVTNGDKG